MRTRLITFALCCLLACSSVAARAQTLPSRGTPVMTTLPSGARILCKQETETPLIAIDVFVTVGVAQETPETAGIGNFVARTLLSSTSNHVPEIITQEINDLGGNVSATWEPDWTRVGILTVNDRFEDAASLLTDVLEHADFDPDAVRQARQQMLGDIDSEDASPFGAAYKGLRRTLYASSVYGQPSEGTPETIGHLQRADLLQFYDKYYVPKNLVIVVVGNIDPQTAIQKLSEDLDDFPTRGRGTRRPLAVPDAPRIPTHDAAPIRAYLPDLSELCIMAGYHAPGYADADYPAMLVANALVGGMKTSRLFTNLREKQSLAYELGSAMTPQRSAGDMFGYALASPTTTDPTTKKTVSTLGLIKTQILRQFDSFKDTPPTAAELARAQHFLIGSYKIKHERIEDRAYLLGVAEIACPGGSQFDSDYASYINKVTPADVERIAKTYFVHPVISTVEPDAAATQASKGAHE